MSIFEDISSDETISVIFDTVSSAVNDEDAGDTITITQKDVDKIASYDGDESSISEEDIIKFYTEKIAEYEKELKENTVSDEPEISPIEGQKVSKPQITTARGLDSLFNLRQLKIFSALTKKDKIMGEITDLINELDAQKAKRAALINKRIKAVEKKITDTQVAISNKNNEIKA